LKFRQLFIDIAHTKFIAIKSCLNFYKPVAVQNTWITLNNSLRGSNHLVELALLRTQLQVSRFPLKGSVTRGNLMIGSNMKSSVRCHHHLSGSNNKLQSVFRINCRSYLGAVNTDAVVSFFTSLNVC
jgi:hypothetical protein